MSSGERRLRLSAEVRPRSVSHYQNIVEGLLERDIGIEKYFSYVIIKTAFAKTHYPLETLFSPSQH